MRKKNSIFNKSCIISLKITQTISVHTYLLIKGFPIILRTWWGGRGPWLRRFWHDKQKN
jgi:hypothetical protein